MPQFDAQSIVDPLRCRLLPFADFDDVIPEPSDVQVGVFLAGLKKVLTEANEKLGASKEVDVTDREQMMAAIRATDVVLFDNLGFIVSLGYKESLGRLSLIRLINARWERQQKTFFTSNATEEQLSEQLGEDSVSRLHALCRFFEVPGLDLRREGGS